MTQKPVKTVDDLPSISGLIAQGHKNRQAFKAGGIDYDAVTNSARYGVTNKPQTFKSFEEEINKNFELVPTLKADRLSKRTGVIGYKIGCTHFWDKWGKLQPCTVIQLDRCQVTQVKTEEKDGRNAIQVGIGEVNPYKMKKAQVGHLLKHNLPTKRHFAEFEVSPECFLPVGYCLGPRHFKIG